MNHNPARKILLASLPALLLLLSVILPAHAPASILIDKTWGGAQSDGASAIATDSAGNLYTTGHTYSFGSGSPNTIDAILLKYAPNGSLLMQKIWGDLGNEAGAALTLDSQGNIYIAGYTNSSGAGGYDALLLKLNPAGTPIFELSWGGSLDEFASGVALDPSGNIYISGHTYSFGAGYIDAFLLKFDPLGTLLFQKTWGGSSTDVALDIAVDSSSNTYLAGWTNSFGPASANLVLLKLDGGGNLLWQKIWGGDVIEDAVDVEVDSSGGIYVVGRTESFGAGGSDASILKFDSTGGLIWERTWGGALFDGANGVAVGSSGEVHVSGSTDSFGAGAVDAFSLRLNATGGLEEVIVWGSSGSEYGISLVVGASDIPIVAGFVDTSPPYNPVVATGNSTLGMPSGSLTSAGNSTLGSPLFLPGTPSGTVGTPIGSESYAGGAEVFLFKYGTPPSPPPTPVAAIHLLAAALVSAVIVVFTRRGWLAITKQV